MAGWAGGPGDRDPVSGPAVSAVTPACRCSGVAAWRIVPGAGAGGGGCGVGGVGSRPDMPSLPPPSSGPGAREGHRAAVVLRVHCPKRGETPAGSREPRACNRQDRRRAAGVRVPPRAPAVRRRSGWTVLARPEAGVVGMGGGGDRSRLVPPARVTRVPVVRALLSPAALARRWAVARAGACGGPVCWGGCCSGRSPPPTPHRGVPVPPVRRGGVVLVSTAAVSVALTDPPARCNCAVTPQPKRKDRELPAARVVFTRLLPRGTAAVELLE